MIISRTPFRVTLGGGGTDLPSFYQEHGGLIFAMGIDKYMYVMINTPVSDRKIRIHYTQSEIVEHVSELKHELAREALRHHSIEDRIEIASMADLPAGTGLGSSSAYLVGLLTALRHYRRRPIDVQALAEEACHLELDVLKKPIGKQDQYMAAFGGMSVLDIGTDGTVAVRALPLSSGSIAEFTAKTHIYYTGMCRSALDVLADQNSSMQNKTARDHAVVVDSLKQIKELGYRSIEAFEQENFDDWGAMLHDHWERKKRLSQKISMGFVDTLYEKVRAEYDVAGGKIIGAGGGGFLMLYCRKNPKRLEQFMESQNMPRLHYTVEHEGAKIVASLSNGAPLRWASHAASVAA